MSPRCGLHVAQPIWTPWRTPTRSSVQALHCSKGSDLLRIPNDKVQLSSALRPQLIYLEFSPPPLITLGHMRGSMAAWLMIDSTSTLPKVVTYSFSSSQSRTPSSEPFPAPLTYRTWPIEPRACPGWLESQSPDL